MVNFDPTPYWRSTVGFDHLFGLLANAALPQAQETYPPYNIARSDEDNYRISLAVAGFTPKEIAITAEENQLTVEGQKRTQQNAQYLYQGISARAFRRTFNLADHVKVKGASFEHGLVEIDLVREMPEAMKPRRIEIVGRDGEALENTPAGLSRQQGGAAEACLSCQLWSPPSRQRGGGRPACKRTHRRGLRLNAKDTFRFPITITIRS